MIGKYDYHSQETSLLLAGANAAYQAQDEEESSSSKQNGGRDEGVCGLSQLIKVPVLLVDQ